MSWYIHHNKALDSCRFFPSTPFCTFLLTENCSEFFKSPSEDLKNLSLLFFFFFSSWIITRFDEIGIWKVKFVFHAGNTRWNTLWNTLCSVLVNVDPLVFYHEFATIVLARTKAEGKPWKVSHKLCAVSFRNDMVRLII